jgi:hypothetical protein
MTAQNAIGLKCYKTTQNQSLKEDWKTVLFAYNFKRFTVFESVFISARRVIDAEAMFHYWMN